MEGGCGFLAQRASGFIGTSEWIPANEKIVDFAGGHTFCPAYTSDLVKKF
jgi:hypothetical protein